ncbi:D-2-hydroxyacid dehydrogenase [Starkeya koreensis]|uniref:D-2-hydroxyacid dehydrogenase n=1 Tax=Ancylobacter koreensis TaxID=266121 RepID=A0ABT0DGP8_9HYPH|nr:D-2-hydroxyacid dehydrogenase [Ancylobacter koreensis]MCK0206448.1 D-2-hydroxyacid dehydrogenase [Ancylobacter koreensis]
MKLVFRLQFEGPAVAALAPEHPDVRFVGAGSHEQAIAELADADVFVVAGPYYEGAIAEAVNNRAPRLRWVQSSSIGTDRFEKIGLPPGVAFTTAAGLKGRTVAEHAMALLLAQVHAVPAMESYKAAGTWARDALRSHVSSVEGGLMLLLGYGSVGLEIARKAKAFDMRVVALNRTGGGKGPADRVETLAALDDWLEQADVVMSTLPLTEQTRHLIGASQLSRMKTSAVIVNVGRGEVFDGSALSRALGEGKIAAACLDVFENEPLPSSDPMWTLPNLILSPHVAGTGGPTERRFAELVSLNLSHFKAGIPLRNQVLLG